MTIQKSAMTDLKMLDTGSPTFFKYAVFSAIILVLTILSWASSPVLAQTAAAKNTNQAESDIPIEEITVYTEMSLGKLRLEINNAKEVMFNVFNDLNTDDRFDIHCEYVKRWQSKIREYECGPVYLKTAREEEVNLFLRSVSGAGPMGTIAPVAGAQAGGAGVNQMNYFNALLESEMKTAFREHVEFRAALKEYEVLQEVYDARIND